MIPISKGLTEELGIYCNRFAMDEIVDLIKNIYEGAKKYERARAQIASLNYKVRALTVRKKRAKASGHINIVHAIRMKIITIAHVRKMFANYIFMKDHEINVSQQRLAELSGLTVDRDVIATFTY